VGINKILPDQRPYRIVETETKLSGTIFVSLVRDSKSDWISRTFPTHTHTHARTHARTKVFGLAAWSENADGTALCHYVQLYRYFVSQSSEFCRHNPLCCFSTSVYCRKRIFHYRISPETFGYTCPEQVITGGEAQTFCHVWRCFSTDDSWTI
jgi:hypothetical protein